MNSNEDHNQKNTADKENSTGEGPKKKPRLKKVILYTLSALAFLFFIVFPILLNMYADRIIGRTLSEIVRIETSGKYALGFQNVSLNVFSRDIGLEGVTLRPDSSIRTADTIDLITLQIPKLQMKGVSWVRSIWQRELNISEFAVHKPVVMFQGKKVFQDTIHKTKTFNPSDLYSHIERYLDLLTIGLLEIDKGSFIIDMYKNGIEEKLEVHDFSLQVDHFHLDSVSHKHQNRLFFSDSLALQLDDGRFYYQKGPLNISFAHLDISTASDVFQIKSIYLEQEKDSVNVLELNVPNLTFHGVDLTEILHGGKIKLSEILLNQPAIVYYPHHRKHAKEMNADSLSDKIFKAVNGQFQSVDIEHIKLKNASLHIPGKALKGIDNLDFPDFDLTLIHLLIDSASRNQRKDLMFLDDFTLISHGQQLSFGDADLDVSYEKLSVNSMLSRIRLTNLVVEKDPTASGSSFRAMFPEVRILGRNFKNDYLARCINLQTLDVNLKNLYWRNIGQDSSAKLDLNNLFPLIEGRLDFIKVDDLEIESETAELAFGKSTEDAVSAAGRINLHFYDFLLDENSVERNKIFYSEGIKAHGSALDVKIPEAGHVASINEFAFDTRNSRIVVDGFQVDTLLHINQPLSVVLDVEGLQFNGVDFDAIYHNQGYFADTLLIDQPGMVLIQNEISTEYPDDVRNTMGFRLGHLGISDGSFIFYRYPHLDQHVAVANVSIKADSIFPGGTQPGFSTLEATLQGISFPKVLAGHEFTVDQMNVTSADSVLVFENLKLTPDNTAITDSISITLDMPFTSLQKFPLLELYQNNDLRAEKLFIKNPRLSILQSSSTAQNTSFHDFNSEIIRTGLLKIFSSVDIDSLLITDAGIFRQAMDDSSTRSLNVDGAQLFVQSFVVNESTNITNSNLLFASDIQLAIDSISHSARNKDKLTLEGFQMTTAGQTLTVDAIKYFSLEKGNQTPTTKIELGSLSSTGLDYFNLIDKKHLELKQLKIDRPDLIFYRRSPDKQNLSAKSRPTDLYEMIAAHFHEVRADDVIVNDVKMKITDDQHQQRGAYLFERIDFRLKNILIDSTSQIFGNRFLYSDDMNFTIRDFRETSSDSLYDYGASIIRFSSNNAILKIDSGFVHPNYSDSVFAARVGVQTDRLAFVFDSLKLTNFRLIEFITKDNLHIDKAELDGLIGDDFRNKLYPFPKNHFPNLPVSGLRSLDFKIRLDTFLVRNSYFKYREYRPPALQPGEIWFARINLQGQNITNDTTRIAQDSLMRFHASALLMGEADLSLNLEFDLERANDNFFANGVLNRFNLTDLNPILEHVAFIKVTKGYNEMLKFNFKADNDVAKGEMDFRYKKMHIRLIDKKTLTDRGFGESIASFIANTFVVRRNNPKLLLFFRDGDIYFSRDKKKSFFNYLAKSALSGVQSTIRGGNEEKKEIRRKRKMERQLKREGRLDEKSMKEMNESRQSQ